MTEAKDTRPQTQSHMTSADGAFLKEHKVRCAKNKNAISGNNIHV
jgi:hypothetical protein